MQLLLVNQQLPFHLLLENKGNNSFTRTTCNFEIDSDVYRGSLAEAPEHLKAVVTRFIERHNVTQPIKITTETNLPPSRGLGSSAAFAVAFVRASYDFIKQPLSDETLIAETNWSEQIAWQTKWYRC